MNTKKDTYKQRNNITGAFARFSPVTLIFPHISFETFFKTYICLFPATVVKTECPQKKANIKRVSRNNTQSLLHRNLPLKLYSHFVFFCAWVCWFLLLLRPIHVWNMCFLNSGSTCICLPGLVQEDNPNYFVFPLTHCCVPQRLQRRSSASWGLTLILPLISWFQLCYTVKEEGTVSQEHPSP